MSGFGMVDAWSKGARAYQKMEDNIFPLTQEVTRLVETAHSRADEFTILDIACGTGQPSCLLAQTFPNAQITATDYAQGMVDLAREAAISKGIKSIKFAVADAQNLSDYKSDSYDVVTCVAAIFIMPDPLKALKEFRRVLKPGGILIATTWGSPEETNFANTVFKASADVLANDGITPPPMPKPALNLWQPEELLKIVQSADFNDIKQSEYNIVFKFTKAELVDFDGHPMNMTVKANIAKLKKISESEAYNQLVAQIEEISKERSWLNGDLLTFPRNVAHIVLAHA